MDLSSKEIAMKKNKLRLLLLAALLTAAALPWAASDAAAACVRYCWHTTDGNACCQTWTCEIVC